MTFVRITKRHNNARGGIVSGEVSCQYAKDSLQEMQHDYNSCYSFFLFIYFFVLAAAIFNVW